jgi:hypothetical protein
VFIYILHIWLSFIWFKHLILNNSLTIVFIYKSVDQKQFCITVRQCCIINHVLFFFSQSSIMVIVCYDCEYNTCSFNNKILLIEFANVVDCVGEVGKRRNVTMGSWQVSVDYRHRGDSFFRLQQPCESWGIIRNNLSSIGDGNNFFVKLKIIGV